ncbi:MAG: hypothetical protein ACOC8K_08090, partial [Gemmatimonadota bacterium]
MADQQARKPPSQQRPSQQPQKGAARGGQQAGGQASGDEEKLNLRALLQEMIRRGASDLHVTVGEPPKIRVDGDLINSSVDH